MTVTDPEFTPTGTTKPTSYPILSEEEVNNMTQVVPSKRDDLAVYRSGIGTLRSSAHRVKANPKTRKKQIRNTSLPLSLYQEEVFAFDMARYNLRQAFTELLLQECTSVGTFRHPKKPQLEDFVLPVHTLKRKVNGGCCEETQAYMSNAVANNAPFLELFDQLVEEVILPRYKDRLIQANAAQPEQKLKFFIQRPPTLRVQPGPGRAGVKPHCDGEYGHQNGELNFWLPLTDPNKNQIDLWCETQHQKGDYHAIRANLGEIISFHGSTCRHFVNRNDSQFTRVSMDFRIGVEGFFDPDWQMNGTTDDHGRRVVEY